MSTALPHPDASPPELRPRFKHPLFVGCALVLGAVVAVAASLLSQRSPVPAGEGRLNVAEPAVVEGLPIAVQGALSSTVGSSHPASLVSTTGGRLVAHGGGLSTVFGATGPTIDLREETLSLRLTAVGRRGSLRPVAGVAPTATGNEVSYARGSVREWYRNGPLGLEQGFTLNSRPAGKGRLTISVGTTGLRAPRLVGARAVFGNAKGDVAASYGGLAAVDAAGRSLPAKLGLTGRTILLHVDDTGARYPVTIDPFVQQGGKLTAADDVGNGQFGSELALSRDGRTAAILAPYDSAGRGAVWVFRRNGSDWKQDGNRVVFPYINLALKSITDVALSRDGAWLSIAYGLKSDYSIATLYSRSGSVWVRQTDLGGGDGKAANVALTDNGGGIVGYPTADGNRGAAGISLHRTAVGNSGWGSQPLPPEGTLGEDEVGAAQFGNSVAVSADGLTALVGGLNDDGGKGAVWAFRNTGTKWVWQKLTGPGEKGLGYFGSSVALSADGTWALIGGRADNGDRGAAWVFTRSGSTWSQQGGKLTGTGERGNGRFGEAVALSDDGKRALIGGSGDNDGKGATWEFTRSGSSWSQQGGKLVGSGGFGAAVAISGDGKTALVGGPADGALRGAVWAFKNVSPPSVTGLSPASGAVAGGTVVTVTGSGFTGATSVEFGQAAATLFEVVSDGQIRTVAPPGASGSADVHVSGPAGTSATTPADTFTYGGTTTVAKNPLVARVVYATVVGHGNQRSLHVRIRVSIIARVQLKLTLTGNAPLQKAFAVNGGANTLTALLPPAFGKGQARLTITLKDKTGHLRTYLSTVLVPA